MCRVYKTYVRLCAAVFGPVAGERRPYEGQPPLTNGHFAGAKAGYRYDAPQQPHRDAPPSGPASFAPGEPRYLARRDQFAPFELVGLDGSVKLEDGPGGAA